MTENMPNKRDVARALILRGSVFVHLDPRKPGVVVPARLRSQPQVVLQIGLDMPVPIPDLKIEEQGVYGTLSFKGVPFTCSVPWDAVFALVGDDAKGMVWAQDMPTEIAQEVERENLNKAKFEYNRLQTVESHDNVRSIFDMPTRRNTGYRKPGDKMLKMRQNYLRPVK
jgi:stringent starvation protein B